MVCERKIQLFLSMLTFLPSLLRALPKLFRLFQRSACQMYCEFCGLLYYKISLLDFCLISCSVLSATWSTLPSTATPRRSPRTSLTLLRERLPFRLSQTCSSWRTSTAQGVLLLLFEIRNDRYFISSQNVGGYYTSSF